MSNEDKKETLMDKFIAFVSLDDVVIHDFEVDDYNGSPVYMFRYIINDRKHVFKHYLVDNDTYYTVTNTITDKEVYKNRSQKIPYKELCESLVQRYYDIIAAQDLTIKKKNSTIG